MSCLVLFYFSNENNGHLCVCVEADDWNPVFSMDRPPLTQYTADVNGQQLSSGFPLTVKDLLLSGTQEPVSTAEYRNILCIYIGGKGEGG